MLLIIIIIFCVIVILVMSLLNKWYKTIDTFTNINPNNNLYTDDVCCTEKEKLNCMKYGKTGICNYNKNNGSCFCQNA
jgi:hypothetical protein